MINRRQLFSIFGYLGIGGLLPKIAMAQSSNGKSSSTSEGNTTLPPHCEALNLVWSTQQALIRELETKYAVAEQAKEKSSVSAESRWWFDAVSRKWEACRPVMPGVFDSTHWFDVDYLIDDKIVASWRVDTEKKEVTLINP